MACTQGLNPRCIAGVCKDELCQTVGETNCGNGCYTAADLQHDPLNCGGCGNACQVGELCIAGQCQATYPSPSCDACPCGACQSGTICCPVGANAVLCVNGAVCPS